ncbi:hypothetical protein ANCDUO_06343 [Ancylostoma duodenale]|uniref:Uncharacterized protein n=1 Tax=Ancylostoma duodenale TaxID=51022 RepID=A0A0C2DL97_9BILA|nr:hypothetical protein ANCDUO_06343 [Ancylostoma duodenale]
MTRNAVLSARIDNGESLNVVEELKAWEADNMTPDEETFCHLSRIYAHSANTQGIIDIINYMKSNEMPISEAILESLIYSMAKGGHYAQAEAFVQKFVASANETFLRTAIARAAVARGEFSVAVNTIASIPIGAKLNQIANNKLLLEVLFDMLDAGESDAIEKAHALYSSNFEGTLIDSLENRLRNDTYSMDDIFAMAESMEKNGLTKDHNLLLLERSINTPRTHEVFSTVQSRGHIERCLVERPALRKGLARRLSEKLTSSNLKKEQRVGILADIATVLFSYDSERAVQDVMANYQVIYVLGGKDVDLAIPALEAIQHPHVRREYATALVQQLLRKGDPLAEEKLNKLLGSGAVQSLIISRIQKQISGLVLNRDKKDAEADRVQLSLAARLLALNFPAENSKAKTTVASKYLISQLQSELLTVDRARRLITYLEKEPRVRLSTEDITASKKALQEKGQKEKAQLLEMLRKRSQTYGRWLESSIEELEEELAHIRDKPNYKPAVIDTMREIILKKISAEKVFPYNSYFVVLRVRIFSFKPMNYGQVERHLRLIKDSTSPPTSRISDLARQLFSTALTTALTERKLDIVKDLWKIRGRLEEALQLVVEQTVESNSAFGQYQLAAAAVRAGNMGILKSVFDVVKRTHGKEVAFLDLAMVLLEEGRTERALKLLDTPQLKISQGKLDYFPDVLRGLFVGLCQHDRASTVGLNKLLVQLCRMYCMLLFVTIPVPPLTMVTSDKANDLTALETLEEEIERVSFPLEQQLRTVFDNLRRRKLDTKGASQ